MLKFSVGGILWCFITFGYRECLDNRGGLSIEILHRKIFCLTVPKTFVGESFTVAIFSGIQKVWLRGMEYRDFPSKIFCLRMPKVFVGEPFCAVFQKVSGNERFMDKRGGEGQDFPPEIFCLTMPKNFVREVLCAVFQKFSGSEREYE